MSLPDALVGHHTRMARRRWALWPLRVVTTVVTIQIFAQAALAGAFLSGHYGALLTHEVNGLVLAGVGLLLPVTAIIAWRPGRYPATPILGSLVTYAAILVQLIVGFTRSLVVHIPLGVVLLVAVAFLCRWAWTVPRQVPVSAASEPASGQAQP